jgi:hypothetical protein
VSAISDHTLSADRAENRETKAHIYESGSLRAAWGRAIAEAVSRWLPTSAARVQSRVWSSGICGGHSGVGAGFLRVLRFPLPFIPPNSPSSQLPGAGTMDGLRYSYTLTYTL